MPDVEITLVNIASPTIGHGNRIIELPVVSWLSAGFWELYDLPAVDRVLDALPFGTEHAPRTYIAEDREEPTAWTSAPLTVRVPATIGSGPGPGVVRVSGTMTDESRRALERTGLVIALAAAGRLRVCRNLPVKMWEPHRWHTTVLVPTLPSPTRSRRSTPEPAPHRRTSSESILAPWRRHERTRG